MNKKKRLQAQLYAYIHSMHHLLFEMKKNQLLFKKSLLFFGSSVAHTFFSIILQTMTKKRNYDKSCRWTIAQTCQPTNDSANAKNSSMQQSLFSHLFSLRAKPFFRSKCHSQRKWPAYSSKTQPILNLRTKC